MTQLQVTILRIIAIGMAVVILFTNHVRADNDDPATAYAINVRGCDEIWSVSTFGLDPCHFAPQQLCVQQLCAGGWERRTIADLTGLHRQAGELPMVMYVHGYRLDFYWARRRGLETYQDLTAAQAAAPPIRYVIWAWPSDDNDRMVISYSKVLTRATQEGCALGWFLAAAGDNQRVGILSYSMGMQVAGSAFEIAQSRYASGCCCNSVAIGSVTNCRWPESPQQAHTVLSGIRGMLVIESREDASLKGYRRGCSLRRPCSPLGVAWLEQYDTENKMHRLDATSLVGEKHQIHEYLKHECIARMAIGQLVAGYSTAPHEGGPAIVECEIRRHCQPGNPASNPRRKPLASK